MDLVPRLCSILALGALSVSNHASAQVFADATEQVIQLSRMSLEELANVEVTSVSKTAQSLASAPTTIYVITREEILRSGVVSIPEALRLAPNLQVAQISSQEYQIGARGFGGSLEAQNFSNKILILIDGRSVYNPLFSGVAYDAQDVLMEDIDRIEVISGPGATLWGANAMNGVINVITRSAYETRGKLLRVGTGNQETAVSARYGASFGDDNAFRAYVKGFDRGPSELVDGSGAGDRWHKAMTGFRLDLGAESDVDRLTILGDFQSATQKQPEFDSYDFTQVNVLGRWTRTGRVADTRLQIYVDRTDRDQPPLGVGFKLNTYDLDFQQSLSVADRHRIVWGFGRRYNDYEVVNTPTLAFMPPERRLKITNVFAQDEIALGARLKFRAGVKFEENSYSGWSTLPDLRFSLAFNEHALFWAAAASAIRSPTPFDVDVEERVEGVLFIRGNEDFQTEKIDAYEIGYRSQPNAAVSWSFSAFRHHYDDLRTIEPTPVSFLPLRWDNLMKGHTYGVELWANVQVRSWWRLSPGLRSLTKRLRLDEGASGILGTAQSGNDPRSSAQLKSAMVFGRFSVDAMLRRASDLPSPRNPSYTELSARVAWRASGSLELAISGFNLLEDAHSEYAAPAGRNIRRSVYAEAMWTF